MEWSLESILEWFFFLILFKNVFWFIYKNSDYNLLPVEGIGMFANLISDVIFTNLHVIKQIIGWQ